MKQLPLEEVKKEIYIMENELQEPDQRAIRLWEKIRITPSLWAQDQYPSEDDFWVTAVMGNRCLYYNFFECGWGWGHFEQWGNVSKYHWQALEMHHIVFQTLFAIDNGGLG